MVFQFVADYLRHRFTANTRHGTHSPFVYKLTDEVIYDFSAKKPYREIEAERKKLLNDDRLFTIKSIDRQIKAPKSAIKLSKVAKARLMPPKISQLIYRLAVDRRPSTIVEFGTNFGISTAYLAKANPNATILAIERYEQSKSIAEQLFSALKLRNINVFINNDERTLTELLPHKETFDWISINSMHEQSKLLACFEWCLTRVTPTSVVVIDGIYRNQDLKSAWASIQNHPKVTVTIDLFWIGLVYFKEDQAREHFKIKF